MRRRGWQGLLWAQCCLLVTQSVAVADEPAAASAEAMARALAEIPELDGAQLSPDGSWIVYSVDLRSVADNTAVKQWWLQRLAPHGGPAFAPAKLPADATAVRWHPSGRQLTFIASAADSAPAFMSYEVATAQTNRMPADFSASAVRAVAQDYVWSPRGTFVAFTATLPLPSGASGLDPRQGVPFERWTPEPRPVRSLFVLEAASGRVRQLTPASVHVALRRSFAWSPDERRLAVTIDHEPDSQETHTDLMLADVDTGALRNLVVRPGMDGSPLWSGDGRWIAFQTHHGVPDYLGGWPAVVAVSDAKVRAFNGAPRGSPAAWQADANGFLFSVAMEMTMRLRRADVRRGSVSDPLPAAAGGTALTDDENFVFSRDARRMGFLRSTIATPRQLFVVALDSRGQPSGTPQRIAAPAADFSPGAQIDVAKVKWPSADGRFPIHGLLLTPVFRTDSGPNKPSPLLVYLFGGPGMVRTGFAGEGWGGMPLYLAQRGYSVLIPNTRGRGGYGDEFKAGIRDGKSNVRGPYGDLMAGVDWLVNRGIADPQQLGILGFSYGGRLTAYTITQTDRFKAAVVNEGVTDNHRFFFPPRAGTYRVLAQRDIIGITDSLDPAVRARMLADSPALNADRIRTPTLLLYGGHNLANEGEQFLSALRRFEVPSEGYVYDAGHVFDRPAARMDSLLRASRWLDHWVRGMPMSALTGK